VEWIVDVLWLILYFLVALLAVPALLKLVIGAPKEMVRKSHHIGYAGSIFLFVHLFEPWWVALLVIAGAMTIIFLAVWAAEGHTIYRRLLIDRWRDGGEIKYSALYALGSFAVLIAMFGNLLPYASDGIVVTAVLSWGVGDALAAIVGKKFGRQRLTLPGMDRRKTWAGSLSMFVGVLVVAFFALWLYCSHPLWLALILAIAVASTSTYIEGLSHHGFDTVFLPLTAATTLYILYWVFSAAGVM